MADPPQRLIALDVLRGVAVMGILLMNIVGFAMPSAAYLNPAAYGNGGPAGIGAWATCFVLVDGKLRALFSLLFGASMLLVIQRAEAAGGDGAAVHLRRMAVLFGIGLAHAYLIWAGDILILYALTGMVALAFAGRRPRELLVLGVLLLALQAWLLSSLIGQLAALRDAASAPGAAAATIRAWRDVADQIGIPSADAVTRALDLYRSGYGAIVHDRTTAEWATPFLQFVDAGFDTLGLMLLGMAGLKSGFLTGAWPRATYRRIAIACYLIGIPALIVIARTTIDGGFETVATVRAAELWAAPFRPVVMLGHAAAILWWIGGSRRGWLRARIAAVGRTALSNYLGTSIAMTTLFYGYGAGLFGTLGRAQLYLIAPVAWLVMLAWSAPWLRRYRYGPAEWLWRSLARGQAQPMARASKDIAS